MAKKVSKKKVEQTYKTCKEESLNGTMILNLEPGSERYPLRLGARKLALILENIEDVRLFLTRNPYVPKVKVDLTSDQKELWKKARAVMRTGLVDNVKIKSALVKGGIPESIADDLIDREITANKKKAESLLDF